MSSLRLRASPNSASPLPPVMMLVSSVLQGEGAGMRSMQASPWSSTSVPCKHARALSQLVRVVRARLRSRCRNPCTAPFKAALRSLRNAPRYWSRTGRCEAHLSARPRRRSRKGSQPSSCPLAADRASGLATKLQRGGLGEGVGCCLRGGWIGSGTGRCPALTAPAQQP